MLSFSDGAGTELNVAVEPMAAVLDALLLNTQAAVVTVDDVGTIRYCSAAGAEVLGREAEQIVGASVFDFLHQDDVTDAARLFVRRLGFEGPDFGHDMRVRHGSGRFIELNVTATMLPGGDLGVAALTMRPDSEIASREIELRRNLVIEEFCNRLGADFMDAPGSNEIMARLEESLGQVALLTGAESVAVFVERHERARLERIGRWVDPLLEPEFGRDSIELELDPESIELTLTQPIVSNDIAASHGGRRLVDGLKVTAVLSCPFTAGHQRGMLLCTRFQPGPEWADADVRLAEKVSKLYGRAMHRARSEELLGLTYQEGPIGFSIRTVDGVFVDCNRRYLEIMGIEREEAATQRLGERLHPEERHWVLREHAKVATGELDEHQLEARVLMPDKTWRWMRVNSMRLQTAGSNEPYVLTSLEDVTENHEHRVALEYAASHDALTGVSNREAMRRRITRLAEMQGRLPDLLLIDLDRFKLINDSLGHMTGDRVLQAVAGRIVGLVREADMVARLGGDEFAVVVPDLDGKHAHRLAERLRRSMDAPVMVDGKATPQSLSIGVALGADCRDVAELMVRADRAMYAAKAQGRNRYVVFDDSMRDESLAQLSMERELRYAIDHGEIDMHFQPEFAVGDQRIVGAEALLRWQHPERGVLAANHFIEMAERSGMIDDVGPFALRRACESFAELDSANAKDLLLRVNISGREFSRPELPDLVRDALKSSGIAPNRLCLEMTETTLMESPEIVLNTFSRLKHLGVEFAIDDFGTGYSSLTYLKQFPVDSLKIDRSFVEDIATNRDSLAIVESIMGLSFALSLDVVAEGIETDEQLQILRSLGCRRAQGYLVSGAVPVQDFRSFLE